MRKYTAELVYFYLIGTSTLAYDLGSRARQLFLVNLIGNVIKQTQSDFQPVSAASAQPRPAQECLGVGNALKKDVFSWAF